MFAKNSRYRRLPEATTLDARGRWLISAQTRPLPSADGVLPHTLVEGDRLDTIAHRYYEEPCLWWRICDANPEFLSPLALLGGEPIVTLRFPLSLKPVRALAAKGGALFDTLRQDLDTHPHVSRAIWRAFRHVHLYPPPYGWITVEEAGKRWLITGKRRLPWRIINAEEKLQIYPAQPPWASLLRGYVADAVHSEPFDGLLGLVGVESVEVYETPKADGTFRAVPGGGGDLTSDAELFDLSVMVTYNRLNLGLDAIAEAIGKGGFKAGLPVPRGRVGQAIAIPPDTFE